MCVRNFSAIMIIRITVIAILASVRVFVVGQTMSSPQESLNRMLRLRTEQGNIIRANSDIFKKYIKTKHSKYSVVAMFTALGPRTKCEICPHAKRQFEILASSYLAANAETNFPMFFVLIDYAEASEAFHTMKLNHVPGVYFFPGNRKRLKSDTFAGLRSGYAAMPMSRWLAEVADIKIKIITPIDFTKLLIPAIVAVLFGIIMYLRSDIMMVVLGNKILWGVSLMVSVHVMTSGQMWNMIRRPAEAGRDANGVRYIQGGRGGQYIFESYIVMAVNMAVAVGFILMNEVPSVKKGKIKKVIGGVGLAMVMIFFGLLVSIFRIKSHGYPYSFLFQ